MSHMISSAISGKRIAPKAPPARRRPAPAPAAAAAAAGSRAASPSAASPPAVDAQGGGSTNLLPSPPPTQAQTRRATGASPIGEARDAQSTTAKHTSHPHAGEDGLAQASECMTTAPSSRTSARIEQQSKKRKRNVQQAQQPPPPPPLRPVKRAKRSSARRNATVQAAVNEDGATAPSPANPPATQSTPSKSKVPKQTSQTPAATAKKAQPRRRSQRTVTVAQQDGRVDTEAQEQDPIVANTTPAPKRRGRKKQDRSQHDQDRMEEQIADAPEDAEAAPASDDPELHEINPNAVSMFELTHDSRHGKISEREKKMSHIDWDEVARKKREALERIIAGAQQKQPPTTDIVESTEGPSGTAEPHPSQPDTSTVGGVRFRIVDGQIVEDETSLAIDRQAQAEAHANSSDPIEEENDLTRRLNRTTWINERRRDPTERIPMSRGKSDPWSEEETDRFYDALKMFGTDFYIISKMFPPKTRKHIKHKYTREEKLDPKRVNNALLGKETRPMNLEHYARETGRDVSVFTKYESFEHAETVIRESMKEREGAMQAAVEEERENQRQQEIQQKQKEKQRMAAEKKREARAAAKVAKKGKGRRRLGMGTLGG